MLKESQKKARTLWTLCIVVLALFFPGIANALFINDGDLSVEVFIDRAPDRLMQLVSYDQENHKWVFSAKIPDPNPGGDFWAIHMPTMNIRIDVKLVQTGDPADWDTLVGGTFGYPDERHYSSSRLTFYTRNVDLDTGWASGGTNYLMLWNNAEEAQAQKLSITTTRTWQENVETGRKIVVDARTLYGKYATLEIQLFSDGVDIAGMPSLKGPPSENPYTDFDEG